MFGRRKIAALVAEFLGTGILTLLILSILRSTIGVPFFVAAGAGLTLAGLVLAFGGWVDAQLNPAITIALWTARKISTVSMILSVVLQFVGAYGAYGLFRYFEKSGLSQIGGHFDGRILVAQALGAGVFGFIAAAAAFRSYKVGRQATVVGVGYLVGFVISSSVSIGLINPAVALGVHAFSWGTYVLGPVLGAVIGVNLYGLLFAETGAINTTVAAATVSVTNTPDETIIEEDVVTITKKPRATRTAKSATTTRKTTAKRATTGTSRGRKTTTTRARKTT